MATNLVIGLLLLVVFSLAACERKPVATPGPDSPRIVTTYSPATLLVYSLKMQSHLVGVNRQLARAPLFAKIWPQVTDLPEIGSKSGINLEQLLALRPSLVVLYPGPISQKIVARLKRYNIGYQIVQLETIDDMRRSLTALAKALKAENRAKVTIAEMQRVLEMVAGRLAQRELNQPLPGVYFASSRDFLTTHSRRMLQHEMITRAGGRDVVTVDYGGWVTVSVEQLWRWQPDIIIISSGAAYTLDSIRRDSRFQKLKAVQNGKIYRIPEPRIVFWDYPGPDVVLGVAWLARTCHPQLFSNIDWQQEKQRYYQMVYGVSYQELIANPSAAKPK